MTYYSTACLENVPLLGDLLKVANKTSTSVLIKHNSDDDGDDFTMWSEPRRCLFQITADENRIVAYYRGDKIAEHPGIETEVEEKVEEIIGGANGVELVVRRLVKRADKKKDHRAFANLFLAHMMDFALITHSLNDGLAIRYEAPGKLRPYALLPLLNESFTMFEAVLPILHSKEMILLYIPKVKTFYGALLASGDPSIRAIIVTDPEIVKKLLREAS